MNLISRISCLLGTALGAALGATLGVTSAQAHECRALGQAQNEIMGQYWLCVGFAVEDGDRPRAGTRNNLDFIPIWVPGNPHATGAVVSQHQLPDEPLDTRRGDQVTFRAQLVHLKGAFYEVPHDEETHRLLDDWFFLKQEGIGYSTPLANTRYVRPFNWFVPVELTEDGETVITYRTPADFITPYPGLYAWIVEGTLKRQGHDPVTFVEKFVSSQPRIPYGPEVVTRHAVDLSTLMGAPEGWFDSVRPATAASPRTAKADSPRFSELLRRKK